MYVEYYYYYFSSVAIKNQLAILMFSLQNMKLWELQFAWDMLIWL